MKGFASLFIDIVGFSFSPPDETGSSPEERFLDKRPLFDNLTVPVTVPERSVVADTYIIKDEVEVKNEGENKIMKKVIIFWNAVCDILKCSDKETTMKIV